MQGTVQLLETGITRVWALSATAEMGNADSFLFFPFVHWADLGLVLEHQNKVSHMSFWFPVYVKVIFIFSMWSIKCLKKGTYLSLKVYVVVAEKY